MLNNYDSSITYHSKAMANIKGFANKQMDRWAGQIQYAPNLSMRGHKEGALLSQNNFDSNQPLLKKISFLPFPKQALVFMCPHYKSFKSMWEKEKFSHSVFYPFGKLKISAIYIKFEVVVCKHFQYGRL